MTITNVTSTSPIFTSSPTADTRHLTLEEPFPSPGSLGPGTQADFATNRIHMLIATTEGSFGGTQENGRTFSFTGAQIGSAFAAVAPTATSKFTSYVRRTQQSAASINVRCGFCIPDVGVFRGLVANTGGFTFETVFGIDLINADSRMFVGLAAGSTLVLNGNVDPSAIVDCCGFGWDAADTNMQFFHNDNAGACTKVDLGSGLQRPVGTATPYYAILQCDRAGSVVNFMIMELVGFTGAEGSANSNLPVNSTLILPHWAINTGPTTAVAVRHAFMRMQIIVPGL